MKKILGIIALALTVVLAFSFAGCGKDTVDSKPQTKSLYDHGLELISLMEEMATSDSYVPMYSGSNDLKEIVSVVGTGDYTEPKAVYKLIVNKDILRILTGMQIEGDLSDELTEYVSSRTYSTIPTQINAKGGANVLAAASVCTAGKTFVSTEADNNAIYLYTFENGLPVMVTFTEGEDNAVSASGCFIFYDEFPSDSIDDMKQLLEGVIDTIEEIKR